MDAAVRRRSTRPRRACRAGPPGVPLAPATGTSRVKGVMSAGPVRRRRRVASKSPARAAQGRFLCRSRRAVGAQFCPKMSAHPPRFRGILALMASIKSILQHPAAALRSSSRREKMTFETHGYGPALDAAARRMRMPKAAFLRMVLGQWLAEHPDTDADGGAGSEPAAGVQLQHDARRVMMKFFVPAGAAELLARNARAAELTHGTYVARLVEGLPVVLVSPELQEIRATLIQSNAMLASFQSDMQALIRGLRGAQSFNWASCVTTISELAVAVRPHLLTATSLVAALAPDRPRPGCNRH